MNKLSFTVLWALLVWAGATLFFFLFGHWVLVEPAADHYWLTLLLLEIGTAVFLYAVTLLYIRFDRQSNAAVKFAVCGTTVGLFLDTFSISYHSSVFASLSEGQVIAFTAWMSCAYALYLAVPLLVHYSKGIKNERKSFL